MIKKITLTNFNYLTNNKEFEFNFEDHIVDLCSNVNGSLFDRTMLSDSMIDFFAWLSKFITDPLSISYIIDTPHGFRENLLIEISIVTKIEEFDYLYSISIFNKEIVSETLMEDNKLIVTRYIGDDIIFGPGISDDDKDNIENHIQDIRFNTSTPTLLLITEIGKLVMRDLNKIIFLDPDNISSSKIPRYLNLFSPDIIDKTKKFLLHSSFDFVDFSYNNEKIIIDDNETISWASMGSGFCELAKIVPAMIKVIREDTALVIPWYTNHLHPLLEKRLTDVFNSYPTGKLLTRFLKQQYLKNNYNYDKTIF